MKFVPALFLGISLFAAPTMAEETSAYAKAVAAYQDRQLDEAFRYAKEAVQKSPHHPDAYALLGELYYLRQELQKAKEAWGKALVLAPSRHDVRERLEKLEKEMHVEENLGQGDTHPFVVRYSQQQLPTNLGWLRQQLRDAYRFIGQNFGYFPDYPITVILYPEEDFDQVKGISHQAGGLFDGKIRLPIRRVPEGSGLSASSEMKRVLWHEYTHAIVHDLARGQCPMWLNEGIATLEESRVQPPDLQKIREAFQAHQLISWGDFFRQKEYEAASMELSYQQAYLAAKFLVDRWGWKKMTALLTRLGEGYPLEDALRSEYKEGLPLLEKEWQRWLQIKYT